MCIGANMYVYIYIDAYEHTYICMDEQLHLFTDDYSIFF